MFPVAFHAITLKESLREIAVVIICGSGKLLRCGKSLEVAALF
jgi:hypothetical protein